MDTHRLTIPDEYGGGWVDIRKRRGWARAKENQNSAFVVRADPESPTGFRADMDMVKHYLAKLESAVTAWSLPLPVDRSGFTSDEFDEALGDWLVTAIDEHYESSKRSDEERKTSAGTSTELSS